MFRALRAKPWTHTVGYVYFAVQPTYACDNKMHDEVARPGDASLEDMKKELRQER